MSTPNFRFKRFTVWHERCAMKVGTDGVLLGAWCPLPEKREGVHILDIGTGTGLIALLLAQRTETYIDCRLTGIDIDKDASEQAQQNFSDSPWSERLESKHCALQAFAGETRYDLIVSNPPYFQNSLKNPDKGREQARHTDSLGYEELICGATAMLKDDGVIALILPAEAEMQIREIAQKEGLTPTYITRVHSKPGREAKRILIAFRRDEATNRELTEDVLYIESETSPRSEAYSRLTQDFYL